jgi:hypothetical protein
MLDPLHACGSTCTTQAGGTINREGHARQPDSSHPCIVADCSYQCILADRSCPCMAMFTIVHSKVSRSTCSYYCNTETDSDTEFAAFKPILLQWSGSTATFLQLARQLEKARYTGKFKCPCCWVDRAAWPKLMWVYRAA